MVKAGGDIAPLLGLAQRAGGVVYGLDAVERSVQRRRALLVIGAEDAAPRTLARALRICESMQTPFVVASSKEELGRAIGKRDVALVAVTDPSLAQGLQRALSKAGVHTKKGRGVIDENSAI